MSNGVDEARITAMASPFVALMVVTVLATTQPHQASHAVQGIVKSASASALVITRSAKKASDLAFVLNPSTLRAGTVVVGSTVAVRYYIQGKTLVATAVTVRTARVASF